MEGLGTVGPDGTALAHSAGLRDSHPVIGWTQYTFYKNIVDTFTHPHDPLYQSPQRMPSFDSGSTVVMTYRYYSNIIMRERSVAAPCSISLELCLMHSRISVSACKMPHLGEMRSWFRNREHTSAPLSTFASPPEIIRFP